LGANSGAAGVIIRDATAADKAQWHGLWTQYLAYYKVDLTPDVTDYTWARLTDPASPMKARLAVLPDRIAGFAIHHHHCSSWATGDDCYLEDLFVNPAARNQGIGRALIEDLQTLARGRG
jgi:GNAT superfamily N-acetyltransferase